MQKQKYYVLHNGEYVLKYRDAIHKTPGGKVDCSGVRETSKDLFLTPKIVKDNVSINIPTKIESFLSERQSITLGNTSLPDKAYWKHPS